MYAMQQNVSICNNTISTDLGLWDYFSPYLVDHLIPLDDIVTLPHNAEQLGVNELRGFDLCRGKGDEAQWAMSLVGGVAQTSFTVWISQYVSNSICA